MWCIAKITPEYRRRMYDILDLYQEPYNPEYPVIGLDEKPKQLLKDSREPIPMKKGATKKIDYEYTRNGRANIFVTVEPKAGNREIEVTRQRTRIDFAFFLKELVDIHYQNVKKLRIVVDNLNTHNEKSLYENFENAEEKRILAKIEFHYTPKHASWLNVAEIEIGIMDNQCTGTRIGTIEKLTEEVKEWTKARNQMKKKIDWRFTRQKADEKMSKHYVT